MIGTEIWYLYFFWAKLANLKTYFDSGYLFNMLINNVPS